MFYPQEVLDDVISQNDIVSVISSYVPLKQKGKDFFGLCPFHKEDSPSFSVSPDKQLYYCFGCGASGNVCGFIMKIENYGFIDAVRFLADRIHYTLPEKELSIEAREKIAVKDTLIQMNKEAARFFYGQLKLENHRHIVKYLAERGLKPEIIIKFGLGFSPVQRDALYRYLVNKGYQEPILLQSGLVIKSKTGKWFDRFSGRIIFPIFDPAGKVVGFGGRILSGEGAKYLNSPDTPVFDKSKNLYGINFARKTGKKEWILVEGYMDVLAVYQAGFPQVVASLGTAFNIGHARMIKKYADGVTILFDSDKAGKSAALRAIPFLEQAGLPVKVMSLQGAKDPDEFIQKFGVEAFDETLKTSITSTMFQVFSIRDQYNLKNPDEKVKFTAEVSKLLAKSDSEIKLEAYINEVSNATGISAPAISAEIEKNKDKTLMQINEKPQTKLQYALQNKLKVAGAFEAKKNICYLLMMDERVYPALKDLLQPKEMGQEPYVRLLEILYDLLERGITFSPAELLNYFYTVEEQKIVSEIYQLIDLPRYEGAELEKNLTQMVKVVWMSYIGEEMDKKPDVAKLQALAEMKRNIQNLNITLSDG